MKPSMIRTETAKRKPPVPCLYFEVPVKVDRDWALKSLKPYKTTPKTTSPHIDDRTSKMSQVMAEILPADGGWWQMAVSASEGQARALCSAFTMGTYGYGYQASYLKNENHNTRPNKNFECHLFFLKRVSK